MPAWRAVLQLDDIIEGAINKATAPGWRIIVLQFDGELYAYEDACPHERHPLSQGELEGDVLTCAKHLWEFDVRTGKHISRINRPRFDLRRFPVRVSDGQVEVELP